MNAENFPSERYHSAEDGLARRNAIPKFVHDGQIVKLNPEWESAEFEEVFIWTETDQQKGEG